MLLYEMFTFFALFVLAISATIPAIKRRFDLFGIAFIAFVTSLGGGTVRDVMLGDFPVSWIAKPYISLAILSGLVISFVFTGRISKFRRTFFWFDTIGIAVMTVVGTHKALMAGVPEFNTVFFGLMSAIFGGIIRDTLCNEVPLIFRKEFYAVPCIVGGYLYLGLVELNCPDFVSSSVAIVFIITFRFLAIKYKLYMPNLSSKLKVAKR
jgi:uncharacterized membrane protein YeiH